MKILWLCNIILPKVAEKLSQSECSGGGWFVGLADAFSKREDIKLTVCSPIINKNSILKGTVEGFDYYCFPQNEPDPTKYNKEIELHLENILVKVNPDIIHIFGTEYPHTLAMVRVCEKLGIIDRVVINIQGLTSIIEKHYFANIPNNIVNRYTLRDLIKRDNIKKQSDKFGIRGKYEIEALKKVKYVIGRTDWDRACTYKINSKIKYYFCNEILRNVFYENEWNIEKCEKYSIFISQCSYPVKGFHFMIEAMPKVLELYPDAHIYTTGINPLKLRRLKDKLRISSYQKYIGDLIKKYNLESNITFLGNLDEVEMCNRFLKSHVFVSPSVIENESNSISEAKILGVPVVASYVGGVTNRIKQNIDGFYYQHDSSYMLSHYICEVFRDDDLALKFSKNAKISANIVNNKIININEMIKIYNEIINQNNE